MGYCVGDVLIIVGVLETGTVALDVVYAGLILVVVSVSVPLSPLVRLEESELWVGVSVDEEDCGPDSGSSAHL